MKIKRSPSDMYFSNIVRHRAGWKCEICGKDFSENKRGLQCSHLIGRGNMAVRWDFDNAAALCGIVAPWGLTGCHKKVTEDPVFHVEFFIKKIGKERYDALVFRSKNETMKSQHLTEKDIRVGLKMEWKRIEKESKNKILGSHL